MFSFLSKTLTTVKQAVTSNEYLVTTGAHHDMTIQKKTSVFRGLYNSYELIDLSPVNYNLQVHALSIDNHPLSIATNFTIGPRADDVVALWRYTVVLTSLDNRRLRVNTVRELVESIIEHYILAFASQITMEQVLTPEFMQIVGNNVQLFTDRYGFQVYNVDDLGDVERHEQQGEEVTALNEDMRPYDEIEIDYYEV